ncbi:hypothetical protein FQN55_003996 [Onygenales sp. PD_40]|nr:hypothetical protein FQN55_003996 [Onygenales sp. PD_40]KAK2789778.1 hypothetical protein FQN52_005904 [Onygenales sp. PD_12]KAK2797151.1 hypothetical protein FQN51_008796 [Onygenales sp. PD_10]
MPTVPLHPPRRNDNPIHNPLPQLLQTPSGLAILELQGTINLPDASPASIDADTESGGHAHSPTQYQTPIGRLIFPDYDAQKDPADTSWMKRVYLYVGRHQRLTGEVKQLPRPLAAIQRVDQGEEEGAGEGGGLTSEGRERRLTEHRGEEEEEEDELEIVEVIRHKIIFSSRPEPVTDMSADVPVE